MIAPMAATPARFPLSDVPLDVVVVGFGALLHN